MSAVMPARVESNGLNEIAFTRETVLIIEDDESVAMLLKLIFQRQGQRVLVAHRGQTGLELLKENSGEISVVIMDCSLPDWEIDQLALRMRIWVPGLPLLFTSGRNRADLARKFMAGGPADFMPKPFLPIDVVHRARVLLMAGALA